MRGWGWAQGRELQNRQELLQRDFEDLGNLQKRLAVGDGLQDPNQPRVGSTNHPDVAGLGLYLLHRGTF